LNKDVPFTSHSFLLEKIKVFVYGMGYLTNIDWHCVILGYKSLLLHKFEDKQVLFVSKIEETLCTVKIYQDQKLQTTYVSNNPINV